MKREGRNDSVSVDFATASVPLFILCGRVEIGNQQCYCERLEGVQYGMRSMVPVQGIHNAFKIETPMSKKYPVLVERMREKGKNEWVSDVFRLKGDIPDQYIGELFKEFDYKTFRVNPYRARMAKYELIRNNAMQKTGILYEIYDRKGSESFPRRHSWGQIVVRDWGEMFHNMQVMGHKPVRYPHWKSDAITIVNDGAMPVRMKGELELQVHKYQCIDADGTPFFVMEKHTNNADSTFECFKIEHDFSVREAWAFAGRITEDLKIKDISDNGSGWKDIERHRVKRHWFGGLKKEVNFNVCEDEEHTVIMIKEEGFGGRFLRYKTDMSREAACILVERAVVKLDEDKTPDRVVNMLRDVIRDDYNKMIQERPPQALTCIKLSEIPNSTLQDVLEREGEIARVDNWSHMFSKDDKHRLEKLTYKNKEGEYIYALQCTLERGRGYVSHVWHFKQDFNGKEAAEFVSQYGIHSYDKRHDEQKRNITGLKR